MLKTTDNAPAWLEDARALKRHVDCPPGLAQFVVSEGAAKHQCDGCGAVLDGLEDCFRCPDDESPWPIITTHPDAVTVPDLSDSDAGNANEGRIAAAVRRACGLVVVIRAEDHDSIRFLTQEGTAGKIFADSSPRPAIVRGMALVWLMLHGPLDPHTHPALLRDRERADVACHLEAHP